MPRRQPYAEILTQVRTEEAKELRRKGIEVFAHRQLEPREDDCCNTITTVQKDYLLQEPVNRHDSIAYKTMPNGNIRAFNASDCKKSGISEMQITHTDNESPTITTAQCPKILEPVSCAVRGRGENNEQRLEIGDNSANCCTSVQKDSMVMEPNGKTAFITDPSVWVDPETNKAYYYKDGCLWRIRRLMPSECLRLMDVSEEDIEKICNCGVSKTGIYSLAGNSIVTQVLTCIFKKLFIDKSNPDQQLTLF